MSRAEFAPLSVAQRRLWFLYRLAGPDPAGNLPLAIALSGSLDRQALDDALRDVAERHPALRTMFREVDGRAQQTIMTGEGAGPALQQIQADEAQLAEALAEAARRGFDLARQLPARAWLFTVSAEDHVLLLVLHRIVADDWSWRPLGRDLAVAYTARCDGREPRWAPWPLGRSEGDLTGRIAAQAEYWKSVLAELPAELTLPADRARPSVGTNRGGSVPLRVDPNLHRRLLGLARSGDSTLFMVVQAGLAALLTRLGAGTDIPVGRRISSRPDEMADDLVGCFASALVLRTDTAGDPSFAELLSRVRTVHAEADAHQDVPFEYLVDALAPARSLARHPLFQVMLAVEDHFPEAPRFAGLASQPVPVELAATTLDLSLRLTARVSADGDPAGLSGDLVYATDLFEPDTAAMIAARLIRLLTMAAAHPGRPVSALEILSPAERSGLLAAGTGAMTQVIEADVAELFMAAVARHPDTVAAVYGDSALTYRELAARSRRLARFLRRRGVGPDVLVGLCVQPSLEMIIGLLGILAAGGAYVPLDPSYPAERTAFMLHDCDPALVLVAPGLRDRIPAGAWAVVSLDENPGDTASEQDDRPRPGPYPASLAYVIYTSGSTGTPKGVAVTHRNIANLVADRYWSNGNHRRVLLHSPFSFDASTYELWLPLLSGGRVIIAPESRGDANELNDTIAQNGVTVAYFTTALLEVLAHEEMGTLRQLREIWAGGDVLSPVALQRVLDECPDTTVVHEYGPTETTVFCSFQRFGAAQRRVTLQTLGDPMDNVRMYLLDDRLRLAPPGVAGDVYLGGAGVAREYLKRRVLSATRFVADPFGGRGARMYRTGDLARWGRAGQLEFVGRADNQVKVRGFRVEPGEVETVLARHPLVGQVAVAAQEDRTGDKCLIGYVVPAGAGQLDVRTLRGFAREHLPEYLIPSLFMIMDRLPLTPIGKLDRRALPPPGTRQNHRRSPAVPRTRAEERVAQVWRDSLGASEVGMHDNFFDLGGDSYLALAVTARLATLFRTDLPVRTIFQFPTITELIGQLQATVGKRLVRSPAARIV